MPKIKTNSGARKRFKKTASGKFKRKKGWDSHLLTTKSSSRKRRLKKPAIVDSTDQKKIQRLLPNL